MVQCCYEGEQDRVDLGLMTMESEQTSKKSDFMLELDTQHQLGHYDKIEIKMC